MIKDQKVLYVKTDKDLHGQVFKAAKAIKTNSSVLVRQAILEKLDRLRRENPEIKKLLSSATA